MNTMNITNFKAHALQIIRNAAELGKPLVITKRGKALAEIIPYKPHNKKVVPGKLASTLVSEKDIISPIGEEWEVNR